MKILMISLENTLVAFGVRQIAAMLKLDGHQVRSLFMPREHYQFESAEDLERIAGWVAEYSPNLIGLSLMTSHVLRAKNLLTAIRRVHSCPVLVGGIHPTIEPEDCLQYAEFICLGEGEYPVQELARALHEGRDPTGVESIWSNLDGSVVRNPVRSRHADLDDYPYGDFERFTQYVDHQGSIVVPGDDILRLYVPGIMDAYYVLSGRGCPHSCTYCCSPAIKGIAGGPYLRRRSVDHFIGEIVENRNRFPYIKGFVFMDDSFLYGDDEWFDRFVERYNQDINLPFLCFANPTAVREPLISKLVQAGLVGVHVGLQSGSPRISEEIYNRGVSSTQFLTCMEILAKHKKQIVDRRVDVITDNPYETEEDTAETIKLLANLEKPFFIGIVSLLFYPHTNLKNRALQDGIINHSYHEIYTREFFHYQPTYLNRVMRTIPVTPAFLTMFFTNHRGSPIVRSLFYLYYLGYFVAIRRNLKKLRRSTLRCIFNLLEGRISSRRILTTRVALIDF